MEDLIKLLDAGYDVKFYNNPKRLNDDFVLRLCWEVDKDGEKTHESKWEGFVSSKACINDCIKKTKNLIK